MEAQTDFFDIAKDIVRTHEAVRKHYHSSDPDTSRKAAEKIVKSGEISKQAALVFYHFKKVAPCTNKRFALLSGLDYEMVHKRVADLKAAGLVEDSGLREDGCAILKLCEGKT